MNLKNAKIVVTGADGFIGSHLTEQLVMRGYSVRAFVLYNSFGSYGWIEQIPSEFRSKIEIYAGDIRDPQSALEGIRGCNVVMHLAALIAIPHSYRAPQSYVDVNVSGTLNVLLAAKALGVERIVQTSTSEVYGTARFVPITEEHPLSGQSPYAASKIGADQMALAFHNSFGLPVSILRPFNTYGPRQSSRAVIPTIITQIAAGKKVIQLGSGRPTRDFSFVSDTVDAFIAVAESDEAVGQVVNSGCNFEVSIDETARLIAVCMNTNVEVAIDPARIRPINSEVERLWADTSKLRRLTNWAPQFGGRDGFTRGLHTTIEWFTDPVNLAMYKPDIYSV